MRRAFTQLGRYGHNHDIARWSASSLDVSGYSILQATAELSVDRSSNSIVSSSYCKPCAWWRNPSQDQSSSLLSSSHSDALQHWHQRRTFLSALSKPVSKQHQERRLIGYSPEKLFEVISQVQHYQQFVPWCQRSTITRRQGENALEAELEVGFQVFVERYTSKVTLKRPSIVTSSVDDSTLFTHLDSSWTLQQGPTPDSTWLTFKVDFAFRSQLYGHVADMFFSEVVQRMMGAFEKRCQQLYGTSSLMQPQQQRVVQQQVVQQAQPAGAKVAAAVVGQGLPRLKSP